MLAFLLAALCFYFSGMDFSVVGILVKLIASALVLEGVFLFSGSIIRKDIKWVLTLNDWGMRVIIMLLVIIGVLMLFTALK